MSPALERFAELLVCAGRRVIWNGGHSAFKFCCCIHDDHDPSCDATTGDRVPVIASCQVCGPDADLPRMLDELGATEVDRDLILGGAPARNGDGACEIVHHDYRDPATGKPRLRMERHLRGGKTVKLQRQYFHAGAWWWPSDLPAGVKPDTRTLLYNGQSVCDVARAGGVVHVGEGERVVDALIALGLPGTCNVGGASESGKAPKWTAAHAVQLQGAGAAVLWEDNDPAGAAHVQAEATTLLAVGITNIRVVRFSDMPPKSDLVDWLGTVPLDQRRMRLQALLDAAPQWTGTEGLSAGSQLFVGLDLDRELEPLPVLLDGLLIDGDLVLGCGTTGDGKTTTQAGLGLALSSGQAPWKGGPVPRRTAPVIYLDAEMGPHMTQRTFKRLMAGMGLDRKPEPLLVVSAPGEVSLVSVAGVRRIEATLVEWSKRHEALGPPVIFLDTLSAVLSGVESFNDAALIEPVYRTLFGWRDRLGATIVLSHHPRKRGRWETGAPTLDQVRDTSTHVAKCSVVWFMEKPARGASCLDIHTLKHRGRDAVPVQRIAYRSEGNDQPIHLSLEDGPQPEVEGEVERAEKLLADFVRQRASAGARYGETMAFAKSQNVSERSAKRSLASLVRLGVLTQKTADGKTHRGRYWGAQPQPGLPVDKVDDDD